MTNLLKWQTGNYARCGLYFRAENKPEIDHVIPKISGGKHEYDIGNSFMLTVTTRKLLKVKN